MKRIFTLILFAAAIVAGSVNAQTSSDVVKTWLTDGNWNGRFWKALDQGQKIAFVQGYMDGTEQALMYSSRRQGGFPLYKELASWLMPQLTFEEIASALDRIYEIPENRIIGIRSVIVPICSRSKGFRESEVQKQIEDLRTRAAKIVETAR